MAYNKFTGRIDVAKGKRTAERISSTYNKLYKILASNERVLCLSAKEFFVTHQVNKENIYFSWKVKPEEKMMLFKQFFHVGSHGTYEKVSI